MQRLLHVRDQVIGVLDPDAQSQKPIWYAELGALFDGQMRVRRMSRFAHQGVYTTKARCVTDESQLANEAVGRAEAAGELDPQHSAKALHLMARSFVVWMRVEPGVVHRLHFLTIDTPERH